MLKISYDSTPNRKAYILEKLVTEKRLNPKFKVIDIGGVAGGGWSSEIANMVIDINARETETSLNLDICDYQAWSRIKDIVDREGKYDYAICSHTLEDVYDPIVALQRLPMIAKQGIITMPSIRTELSNVESASWLGYIHHRWMFTVYQDMPVMLIVPKLSVLESLAKGRVKYHRPTEEIAYEWTSSIQYEMFMNNYLGPTADHVVSNYRELIERSADPYLKQL